MHEDEYWAMAISRARLKPPEHITGSPLEVFLAFLRLGLRSFGGPIAHLGYFRAEFVVRRRWLEDAEFSEFVALCQFLPGPASSQVGFSLGLVRAGYVGALAAWTGFTLPSAVLMVLFAYGASALDGPIGVGLLHGLKLVAVAIVAHALWGMARTLCPDRTRATIAALAAALVLFLSSSFGQIAAIALGALAGFALSRMQIATPPDSVDGLVSTRVAIGCLAVFFGLLFGLPLIERVAPSPAIALLNAFYRSGALVFGGGHVVLPLLRDAFVAPGWVSDSNFLAGYGAAQAVPGPLFTFAAFLGVVATPGLHGTAGAALGLVGIFLPGLLILLGTLPFWRALRASSGAQATLRGVNAAVVGLLAAALYNPLWINAVHTGGDVATALAGFILLTVWRAPPVLIVILGALAGISVSGSR